MNLDEIDLEVRDSLLAHADDAPSGAGTLDAVRARSRRLHTRRRAGMAGIAALVAVAAAVGTPYALASAKHNSTGPRVGVGGSTVTHTTTAPPTTTKPPTVTVTDRQSRVALVSGSTLAPVAFPLDPTFVPAGLSTPDVGRTAFESRLVYGSNASNTFLVAAVDDMKPTPGGSGKAITINGHPATLYGSDGNVTIVWKFGAKWVNISSSGLTVANVEHFARGLQQQPYPRGTLPFTLALVPQGYVVSFQEIHPDYTPPGFYISLTAAAEMNNQLSDNHVFINNSPDITDEAHQVNGQPIEVAGYPGKLYQNSDQVIVYVLRSGFTYAVGESNKGPLSNADLIRLAAGVAPQ